MGFLNTIVNQFNALVGRNQDFDQLLAAKDISRVISYMTDNSAKVNHAIKEYDIAAHEIMKRPDKTINDKNGKYIRTQKRWRLPIPYQVFINEISLVFLYGRAVKWTQSSEGTDDAFQAFKDLIKNVRFDSKIRQCKRLAGAETESAMLFRVYRNSEGKPDVQIRVLAKSKGDEIRAMWDQYERLITAGWGYYLRENGVINYHFDIYTAGVIYRCTRANMGWEVIEEPNPIGKIPLILFNQPKEWDGVEHMIEREEYIGSRSADVNDYFSDPAVVATADILNNLPEKESESKVYILKEKGQINYLTWDSAPESKKLEIEWLEKHILSKSFTPNIDFDNMKGLTNVSGKALKQMMVLADIKAAKHKEIHDELLDRVSSLCKAVIGNVLNYGIKAQCDNLIIGHEFQEPFGEDIKDTIDNLAKSVNAGGMSTETFVELNPLVKDTAIELTRLDKEGAKKQKAAIDSLFNPTGV
ncbi:MAG: phage portal protein [Bacteroidetes bacterium]|nr:phage portal protein [Bacteroidota bacterium]